MALPGPKFVGGLLALSISAVACARADPATSTPTTAERPTTTAADSIAEILAAYRGFWDAVDTAHASADPSQPALAQFATGVQLERSRAVAAEDRAGGLAVRDGDPPTVHHPRVSDRAGNAAVVVDCWLDTTVLYHADTGEVVDDEQEWDYGEFRLVRIEGRWKVEVSDIRNLEEGESCDALAR